MVVCLGISQSQAKMQTFMLKDWDVFCSACALCQFDICLAAFLAIGLDELKNLFQPKQFCDTMIL